MQTIISTISAYLFTPDKVMNSGNNNKKLYLQKEEVLRQLLCASPADYIIRNCFISEYHVMEVIEQLDNFAAETQEKFFYTNIDNATAAANKLLTDLDHQFNVINNELTLKLSDYLSKYEALTPDQKNELANELNNDTFKQSLIQIKRCIVEQELFVAECAIKKDFQFAYPSFEKKRVEKLMSLFPMWNLTNLGKELDTFQKHESAAILFSSHPTELQGNLLRCQSNDLILVSQYK